MGADPAGDRAGVVGKRRRRRWEKGASTWECLLPPQSCVCVWGH